MLDFVFNNALQTASNHHPIAIPTFKEDNGFKVIALFKRGRDHIAWSKNGINGIIWEAPLFLKIMPAKFKILVFIRG